MPNKSMHPCNAPGCPKLTTDRHCDTHKRVAEERGDKERGTATERGYGAEHRRWRMMILARDPLCVVCLKEGRTTPSTDADHIDGNQYNRSMSNGQGLCHACHSRKTATENNRWTGRKE
jgi:5-methylcytosine-specific restriction enzyme A